jgi:hypothetical protein
MATVYDGLSSDGATPSSSCSDTEAQAKQPKQPKDDNRRRKAAAGGGGNNNRRQKAQGDDGAELTTLEDIRASRIAKVTQTLAKATPAGCTTRPTRLHRTTPFLYAVLTVKVKPSCAGGVVSRGWSEPVRLQVPPSPTPAARV